MAVLDRKARLPERPAVSAPTFAAACAGTA